MVFNILRFLTQTWALLGSDCVYTFEYAMVSNIPERFEFKSEFNFKNAFAQLMFKISQDINKSSIMDGS